MLTVKNYFAFVLQKIAMVANKKFCNKSFIFYPIYIKHINIKNIFFSSIICNNSKNDKKIYPPLVTMSSIYFLIVLVIISLSRYTVR